MKIEVIQANYLDAHHAQAISYLLDCYATDPMGGAAPLPTYVKENLATELAKIPNAFSIICYADGNPAGLINCFEGFSTFKCKPLLNIHDVVVINEYRGMGLCQIMFERIEEIARQRGYCKMTLEVLEGNKAAQSAYLKNGFVGYELDPAMGKALFWQKTLDQD